MSTLPRALHRARLWTTGLLAASTVLVGALGFHLADAHAQAVATKSSSPATDGSSGSGSSDDGTSRDSSSRFSDQDSSQDLPNQSSNQGLSNQGSGFSQVGPVGGGGFQPQTNSGGS